MNELQQRLGVILSTCVDLAKGSIGQAFAVTLVCRHRSGPAHIIIGDDKPPVVISALEELERFGTRHIDDGEETEEAVPATERMAAMLREAAALFRTYEKHHREEFERLTTKGAMQDKVRASRMEKAERNGEIAGRIEAMLVEMLFDEAPVETVHIDHLRDGE